MKTNILASALALSSRDLLERVAYFARTERESTAELVGHLAALELRPSLYAELGYGSLFDYCTQVLGLSEDAACSRTRAARTCRAFPVVLELLSAGAINLTTLRLLQPHLTAENHEAVLARATNRRKADIEALVAELAPQPDVPTSVRKLPSFTQPMVEGPPPLLAFGTESGSAPSDAAAGSIPSSTPDATPSDGPHTITDTSGAAPDLATSGAGMPVRAGTRPIVRPLSPSRYRVQFTIGQETHDKLRRLQALLRREVPSGDVAVIFDQAVDLMLGKVERAKLGAKARSRQGSSRRPVTPRRDGIYENRIRSRTDHRAAEGEPDAVWTQGAAADPAEDAGRVNVAATEGIAPAEGVAATDGVQNATPLQASGPSRHIPNAVKRVVWRRDEGQCAFVSADGHRCTQRTFLELHHIRPYALDGPPTVGNISLRCRRHNVHEAELVFGPGGGPTIED